MMQSDSDRREPAREPTAEEERWTTDTGEELGVSRTWTSAMNAFIGLGLVFLSPWLKGMSGFTTYPLSTINHVVAGLMIALFGFMGARDRSPRFDLGQAIMGAWLFVAPFLVGGHANEGFDSFLAGTVVTFLAVIGMAIKMPAATGRRRAM